MRLPRSSKTSCVVSYDDIDETSSLSASLCVAFGISWGSSRRGTAGWPSTRAGRSFEGPATECGGEEWGLTEGDGDRLGFLKADLKGTVFLSQCPLGCLGGVSVALEFGTTGNDGVEIEPSVGFTSFPCAGSLSFSCKPVSKSRRSRLWLTGGGALAMTRRRFGSCCFSYVTRFRRTPSTMLIKSISGSAAPRFEEEAFRA